MGETWAARYFVIDYDTQTAAPFSTEEKARDYVKKQLGHKPDFYYVCKVISVLGNRDKGA